MLVFSTHAFTEGDVLSSFFGWLYAISTHAFTEGDVLLEIGILACNHFNSRLHGRRPVEKRGATISELFQLTPSRKATANSNNFCC